MSTRPDQVVKKSHWKNLFSFPILNITLQNNLTELNSADRYLQNVWRLRHLESFGPLVSLLSWINLPKTLQPNLLSVSILYSSSLDICLLNKVALVGCWSFANFLEKPFSIYTLWLWRWPNLRQEAELCSTSSVTLLTLGPFSPTGPVGPAGPRSPWGKTVRQKERESGSLNYDLNTETQTQPHTASHTPSLIKSHETGERLLKCRRLEWQLVEWSLKQAGSLKPSWWHTAHCVKSKGNSRLAVNPPRSPL